jgi:FKBP-type peptidyl-prolyl cis-trans isomerase FklB
MPALFEPEISMRKYFAVAAMLLFGSTYAAAQSPHLATDIEKLSYAIGMQFGRNLVRQGLNKVDPASLSLGVQDVMNGAPPRLTEEQVKAAQSAVQSAMLADQREGAKKNLQDGLSFLANNKKQEGVVTLPSGAQYRVITAGTGTQPKPTDTVVVNYRGTLLTGQQFDSSYDRGEPLTFGLDQVIAGWQQVVSNIKTGTTVDAWIPPNLAYGERGSPPTIPANSTLYFRIELIEIQAKQ